MFLRDKTTEELEMKWKLLRKKGCSLCTRSWVIFRNLQNTAYFSLYFSACNKATINGVHSKCPGSKCPAYHIVSILGPFFYFRDSLKFVRDTLTQMTVHQIVGTQWTNYVHTQTTTRGQWCTLMLSKQFWQVRSYLPGQVLANKF